MSSRVVQKFETDSQGNPIAADSQYNTKVVCFKESSTDNYSMAVDAAVDVEQVIWDGEGSYWSDPSIGSKVAGSAHTGSYGWDSGVTSLGAEVMWDRGTKYDPPGDHVEFWLRLTALPDTSQLQARWEDNGRVLLRQTTSKRVRRRAIHCRSAQYDFDEYPAPWTEGCPRLREQ